MPSDAHVAFDRECTCIRELSSIYYWLSHAFCIMQCCIASCYNVVIIYIQNMHVTIKWEWLSLDYVAINYNKIDFIESTIANIKQTYELHCTGQRSQQQQILSGQPLPGAALQQPHPPGTCMSCCSLPRPAISMIQV